MLKIQRPIYKHKSIFIVLSFITTLSLVYSSLGTLFTNPHTVYASSPWTQTDWSGGGGQTSWSDSTKYSIGSDINDSTAGQLSLATNDQYQTHWGEGFKYRKQLTFDNSAQAENLANFPVLVKLTSSNFDFSKAQTAGQDIRFADSDDSTTLPYEIEKWNAAGQEADIWVKVPQVDASSNTDFMYMYYGNSSATDGQNAAGVWDSNFTMVQHLKETSGQHQDSTANNNDATTTMVTNQGITPGAINGADEFNGSSNWLNFTRSTTFNPTNFTISFFVKPDSVSGNQLIFIMGDPNSDGFGPQSELFCMRAGAYIECAVSDESDFYTYSSISTSSYYWFSLTFNGSTAVLYKNGQVARTDPVSNPINTTNWTNYFSWGDKFSGGISRFFDGKMDEIRVSNTARSAAWTAAEYASMNNTFVTYGDETQFGWWGSAWKYRQKITFDNSAQAENLVNFPVLVKLNSSRINYSLTKDNGEDVRFSDADGITTLPYEIEKWDENGDSFVWVKVPQIDASSSTDFIYIYYGNNAASDGQNKNAVWDSNYKMVQHMEEISGGVTDSTSNSYDSGAGGPTFEYSRPGIVGRSIKLNDSGDFRFPDEDESAFYFGDTNFTLEIVLKTDPVSNNMAVISSNGYSAGWTLRFSGGETTTPSFWLRGTGSGNICVQKSSSAIQANAWTYLAIPVTTSTTVAGDNQFTIYLNGQVDATSDAPTGLYRPNMPGPDNQFSIGFRPTANNYFWGDVDEVRISTVRRSSSWIAAQYASMNDTFNSYGSIEGQYESSGTLTSSIFDTAQSSNWGNMSWTQSGTETVGVKARTSNSATMEGATDWGNCQAVSNSTDISTNNCVTNGQRYAQYYVSLSTTDPNVTPVLEDITLAYDLNTSPAGTISINSGATYTNSTSVILTLSATDDLDQPASLQMLLSNDSSFAGTSWETYAVSKAWILSSGDGTKTVYVKFKDLAGNVSEVYTDTIIFDETAPTDEISINSGATHTKTREVTLTLNSTDVLSGVYQMMVSNDSTFTGASWEAYAASKAWTLNSGDGTKTVYIKFKDNAGNVSAVYSDSIILDTTLTIALLKLNGTDFTSDITTWEVTSTKPPFFGTTEPGATVTITIHSATTVTATVIADANGNWSWTPTTDISPGTYTVTIASQDSAGNIESLDFTMEVKGPAIVLPNTGIPLTIILLTILFLILSGAGTKIIFKLQRLLSKVRFG